MFSFSSLRYQNKSHSKAELLFKNKNDTKTENRNKNKFKFIFNPFGSKSEMKIHFVIHIPIPYTMTTLFVKVFPPHLTSTSNMVWYCLIIGYNTYLSLPCKRVLHIPSFKE